MSHSTPMGFPDILFESAKINAAYAAGNLTPEIIRNDEQC